MENDNPIATFTTDSATLATTGAYTNTINLWDLYRFFKRGKIIIKNSTVQAMRFSQDDLALFVLLADGKIKMYGARMNEPVLIKDITPGSKVTSSCLEVSQNKHYLLSGCNDSKIRVWDIENAPGESKQVFPQEGHTQAISSVAFSNDNTEVFTAGNDEGIYIWKFQGDIETLADEDGEYESFSQMLPGRPIQALHTRPDESAEVDKLGHEIFVKEQEEEGEYKEEEHKSPTYSEVKKHLMAPGTPPGNIKFASPMKDVTNASKESPVNRKQEQTIGEDDMRSLRSEKTGGTQQVSLSPLESRTQIFLKGTKSGALRRAYKFKKFIPNIKSQSPTKSPKKVVEPPSKKYIKTSLRENNKLPFKHYALEGDGRLAEHKSKTVFKYVL